ncbi:MAG TPA: hypothetical protein VM840_10060 [Actinomycetota bacterium]|nr:hypothetical protein [Actinomycetota bacterium]
MRFRRHQLPVGDETIPVLVSSEEGVPKAVFMSYEAFLELAAALYTAIEALKVSGVDPDELFGPDDDDLPLDLLSDGEDAEPILRQVYPPVGEVDEADGTDEDA